MNSNKQTVKALIWDLDGTIIDSFNLYKVILKELSVKYGLEMPEHETLLANYHGALGDSIGAAFGGKLKDKELDAFIHDFLVIQGDHYAVVEGHLLEDAIDLSQRASKKGLKQVIVSNRDHQGRGNASPRSIVANSMLKEHIHEIICGDEAQGFRKPDPKVMGDLLERWGIKPAEALVIGDQHVDAQLALNLNAKAVIVCRDGVEFAHAHKLDKNWQEHVRVVDSLKDVEL